MTQAERIIEYMKKNGTISSKEAFNELGITKLSTRISEMRANGKKIYGVTEYSKNRFGEKTHYTRYALTKKALKERSAQ